MKYNKYIAVFFTMLALALFNPTISISPDGVWDFGVEQVMADDGNSNSNSSNSNSQTNSSDQAGKKEEEEDSDSDSDSADDDAGNSNSNSSNSSSQTNSNDQTGKKEESAKTTVSREEYDALLARVEAQEARVTQQTINDRLAHATKEQLIDGKDADAVAAIKDLAKNDDAWAAYLKTAKPIVPGHIAAQNHFATKTKSTQAPSNPLMDKVLEHQKIKQV